MWISNLFFISKKKKMSPLSIENEINSSSISIRFFGDVFTNAEITTLISKKFQNKSESLQGIYIDEWNHHHQRNHIIRREDKKFPNFRLPSHQTKKKPLPFSSFFCSPTWVVMTNDVYISWWWNKMSERIFLLLTRDIHKLSQRIIIKEKLSEKQPKFFLFLF
jgi:hypothetical protein